MTTNESKDDISIEKAFFADKKDRLPIIRITKIIIDGFKSVEHGEVFLNCGKQHSPDDTQSDILGIYGQNGSGKTTLIQALAILDMAMGGDSIEEDYSDCISVKSGISNLSFTFNLRYPDNEIRTIEYSFSIEKIKLSKEEIKEKWQKRYADSKKAFDESIYDDERKQFKIRIFDETIKMQREMGSKKIRTQTLIKTSGKQMPFGPSNNVSKLIGTKKEYRIRLSDNRETVSIESKSFVFNEKTLKIFIDSKAPSLYIETIMALRYFANNRLFVIDTRPYGLIGLNFVIPIHTKEGGLILGSMWQKRVSAKTYDEISEMFSNMSTVISQLVPGLSIGFKKISESVTSKGEPGFWAMPVAYRGETEIPLRDESDGVRKIISILGLLIAVYNDESITVAIDELDAGIFEYLLGELLQSFEESGKGQLIFTSHNLRPLEVIDKKFIVFTTTNENNRYYRFKDLSQTNNLRSKYYHEIILGEQEETLYNRTKRSKIESAMRKAYKRKDEHQRDER